MAIYTRFGTRVIFTEAVLAPSWFERRPGETRLHFKPPNPTKKTKSVEERPEYLVRAVNDDDRADHGPRGRKICDGKLVSLVSYVADDGLNELMAAFYALNPEAKSQFETWNKGGPVASAIWQQIDEKQVA